MKIITAAVAVAVAAGGLVGCSVSLKDKKIKVMEAQVADDKALCPGEEWGLVARVQIEGEPETLVTEGYGRGDLEWENFRVELGAGEMRNSEGGITAPKDPRDLVGKPVIAKITSRDHPEFTRDVPINFHFDCVYRADFSGRAGRDGANGGSGSSGGKGQNGGNGQSGQHGDVGGHANAVQVYVTLVKGDGLPSSYLQVSTKDKSTQETRYYLVDTKGGSLTVEVDGGIGGKGGKGGDGGGAGQGGNGGDGGMGGDGGNGGDGASVEVYVDPAAEPYMSLLKFENGPGKGGRGGNGGDGGSGASRGRTGSNGRPGQDGRGGPQPMIMVQPVEQIWPMQPAGTSTLPAASQESAPAASTTAG